MQVLWKSPSSRTSARDYSSGKVLHEDEGAGQSSTLLLVDDDLPQVTTEILWPPWYQTQDK